MSDFTQVFRDDFSGTSLDRDVWNTLYSGGYWNGMFRWDPEQVELGGGVLTIATENEGGSWVSGGVSTIPEGQTYGSYEFRARLDAGQGTSAAILLWPTSNEWTDEVDIVEAYRRSISTLDWMSPATRERALDKLGKFTPKVGYPEKWKDYSDLQIDPADLLGNAGRAAEWRHDFEYAKLGGPVDHGEWLMTPQTVNAYYHPRLNEIVFPAAILQPPFFDADADDAANYGGIGAVIGHEIGHGFDDQGSRYDGDGNLTDWGEAADRTEFESRAKILIDQYDGLSPAGLPDHKVKGSVTVGENIGDLGWLTISLKAYGIAHEGSEPPVIDDLTGEQRVLFGWAQVWRAVTRDAEAIRRLTTDPHSPPDLRCNAVVTNLDTVHEACGVTEDDGLYTDPDRRVRIW